MYGLTPYLIVLWDGQVVYFDGGWGQRVLFVRIKTFDWRYSSLIPDLPRCPPTKFFERKESYHYNVDLMKSPISNIFVTTRAGCGLA